MVTVATTTLPAPTAASANSLAPSSLTSAPRAGLYTIVGVMAGLGTAAGFATSGSLAKPLLTAGWSPAAAVLMRLTVGAALLAIPALLAVRGRLAPIFAEWRTVIGFGVFGLALPSTMYFLAIDRIPVAVALLIEYTGPLLLVGAAWLRTRRAPSRTMLFGVAAAMLGVICVLDVTAVGSLDPLGLVFSVIGALGNAAYFAASGRPSSLPSITLAGAGTAAGAIVVAIAAATGLLPLTTGAFSVAFGGTHVPWWLLVVALALLPTAIALPVSATSVRILGERVGSFLALSEVVIAVLLAWAVLGEQPTLAQALGAVGILTGVALVRAGNQPASIGQAAAA